MVTDFVLALLRRGAALVGEQTANCCAGVRTRSAEGEGIEEGPTSREKSLARNTSSRLECGRR